jgi:hypothetical protein
MRTLMKIAGGTRRYSGELGIDSFIDQADSFGKMQDEGPLGRYITIFQSLFRSHPFPIWRTKEVIDWVTTGSFLEILDGDYKIRALVATRPCPQCNTANKVGAMVCSSCGHQLVEEPSGEAAERAVREVKEAAGVDDGDGDFLGSAWKKANSWYKKNFTMDDHPDGPVVDGEPPEKKQDPES